MAGRSLATCRRLVQSMPGMLTALAEGTLNPRSVHTVGSAMGPVPPVIWTLPVAASQVTEAPRAWHRVRTGTRMWLPPGITPSGT